jgi:broad specificity phosphatase PhoE
METAWNEQQRYIGVTDLPLSEAGVKNAQLLAEFLKTKPIKKNNRSL